MNRNFTIALPIEDRQRSYEFYQSSLGLKPVGEAAEDGVPEPLQFQLDEHVMLMLVPSGGFDWVTGNRQVAPPDMSEVLLSLEVSSAEEVTTTVERIKQGGGSIAATPDQQEWGFTGVATDPDGHAWQIIAAPQSS